MAFCDAAAETPAGFSLPERAGRPGFTYPLTGAARFPERAISRAEFLIQPMGHTESTERRYGDAAIDLRIWI